MLPLSTMSDISAQKPLLNVFKKQHVSPPPLWIMRQAGRYLPEYRDIRGKTKSFLTMCYTPEIAAEVTLQPIRRFDFDAAILFSDILVIPHAMGMQLDYIEGKGPVMEALKQESDIENLSLNRMEETLSPIFKAVEMITEELPSHTALIGFAGAPWTVATYMLEGGSSKNFSKVKGFGYSHPQSFENLLDRLVEATGRYLIAQIKAGAEVVQLFDTWAGVLSEKDMKRWVITPTKKIVKKVKSVYPDVPFIGFPKGVSAYLEEYVKETGVDAVGLDYTVPRQWAADILQSQVPVQGNLDPCLLASDRKAMLEDIKNIKKIFGAKPYIFNLGHGILPHTPIENVEALVEAVRAV